MTEPSAATTQHPPPEDPTTDDRFTLAVWRALRDTAAPLEPTEVTRLAEASGLDPARLTRRLRGASERDEHGRLLGLAGLTVADHPHTLWFGDRRLATWCAWDPFFLAPALGGAARLETADPVTGHRFTVDFLDGQPQPTEGDQPVLSMVDRAALRGVDAGTSDSEPATAEEGPATGSQDGGIEEVWSSF